MDITYLGHSSFRLKGRGSSLVTDPFDPEMVGLKFPKVSAEIVTLSHDHGDHNKADLVSDVRKVINGPGEYEISGVSIIGISAFHDPEKGRLRGKNNLYLIEMDEVVICHLGDLGHKLSDKTLDLIGDVDVLMVPVGGEYTIGPTEAVTVSQDIGAKIIIPMHYQVQGLKQDVFAKLSGVEKFLTLIGLPVEKAPKLSVKKEILGEEQKVVYLEIKS